MTLALLVIIFRGSTSDGQSNAFSNLFNKYIEETAISASANIDPSALQLADINSVIAYPGHDIVSRPSTFNTIQDNSVVFRGTILTSIIEDVTDRGHQIAGYTVQEGDNLSFIASDYGISVNTLIWANGLKNADDLRIGQELKIPPVTGVIHKVKKGDTVSAIAKKYGVEEEKIISFNTLPRSGELRIDDELIIPDGKLAATSTAARVQTSTAKRFAYLPNLGDFFFLPTNGYNWGRIHGRNGVDIANSCGTPVYASADGSVNLAKASGWNGGFGNFVRVVHSNGTETLYAHLSKVLVGNGEYVARGQQIALMGTTGRSTGCHLHFEVHGAKNPLAKY